MSHRGSWQLIKLVCPAKQARWGPATRARVNAKTVTFFQCRITLQMCLEYYLATSARRDATTFCLERPSRILASGNSHHSSSTAFLFPDSDCQLSHPVRRILLDVLSNPRARKANDLRYRGRSVHNRIQRFSTLSGMETPLQTGHGHGESDPASGREPSGWLILSKALMSTRPHQWEYDFLWLNPSTADPFVRIEPPSADHEWVVTRWAVPHTSLCSRWSLGRRFTGSQVCRRYRWEFIPT